jgi:hypothetical protein
MVPLPICTRPSSVSAAQSGSVGGRSETIGDARRQRPERSFILLRCSCSMFWTPVGIPSLRCLDISTYWNSTFQCDAYLLVNPHFRHLAGDFAYVVSMLMTSPAYGWSTSMAPPRLMSRCCVPHDHSPTPSSRSILQYSTPIIYAEVRISKAL